VAVLTKFKRKHFAVTGLVDPSGCDWSFHWGDIGMRGKAGIVDAKSVYLESVFLTSFYLGNDRGCKCGVFLYVDCGDFWGSATQVLWFSVRING